MHRLLAVSLSAPERQFPVTACCRLSYFAGLGLWHGGAGGHPHHHLCARHMASAQGVPCIVRRRHHDRRRSGPRRRRWSSCASVPWPPFRCQASATDTPQHQCSLRCSASELVGKSFHRITLTGHFDLARGAVHSGGARADICRDPGGAARAEAQRPAGTCAANAGILTWRSLARRRRVATTCWRRSTPQTGASQRPVPFHTEICVAGAW